jgi:hypothetical protein
MLKTLHGQARRDAAIRWLTDAQQTCSYGATVYVQNTLHRYLAGAVNQRIELLTWTLQAPEAKKTQLITKKREI